MKSQNITTFVGAFVTRRILCAPRTCGAPRKRLSVRERITRRRLWAARMSSVRGARCAPLTVRVAIVTTRTYACAARSLYKYKSALPSEFRLAFFFTFIARNSAGFSLLVSASALRFVSTAALRFVSTSALRLVSASVSAHRLYLSVVASDSTHSLSQQFAIYLKIDLKFQENLSFVNYLLFVYDG